jgi:hypothetical protein
MYENYVSSANIFVIAMVLALIRSNCYGVQGDRPGVSGTAAFRESFG